MWAISCYCGDMYKEIKYPTENKGTGVSCTTWLVIKVIPSGAKKVVTKKFILYPTIYMKFRNITIPPEGRNKYGNYISSTEVQNSVVRVSYNGNNVNLKFSLQNSSSVFLLSKKFMHNWLSFIRKMNKSLKKFKNS